MDFFKSILSEEDPDPPSTQPDSIQDPPNPNPNSSSSSSSSTNPDTSWSFGGFIKTLSTRSESVIETYRRDLEEFRTGLQKETELFKEAATRAVKELPGSIEVGASVAQGMIKSTAEIISHGKDTFLANVDADVDGIDGSNVGVKKGGSGIFSRFDVQLRGIQCDIGSYLDDPEDIGEYEKWKGGFVLEDKREEVERIRGEGGEVEGMFVKLVVSGEVDETTFWCRYFFRVWELKRRENVRERLVKRAIEVGDEEELSWDVDDDDNDDEDENEQGRVEEDRNVVGNESSGVKNEVSEGVKGESGNESRGVKNEVSEGVKGESGDEGNVVGENVVVVKDEGTMSDEVNDEKLVKESDENVVVKGVNDLGESSEESNVVVPTRTLSREEEDLEWDEIDDVDGNDEKKVSHGESASKADTRKRLSVAEEDEDLSWDIEDEDEPEKANAK